MSSIIISLAGPDGVGKTTTINFINQNLPSFFTGVKQRNWRPGLLPSLAAITNTPPQSKQISNDIIIPRIKPGRFQFFRQVYYLFDFIIGHYLKDLPLTSRLKLVLYDRSYIDIFVHPQRFGYALKSYTWWFYKLIPKPQAAILLSDTLERIYNRKQELSKKEIKNQLHKWYNLVHKNMINYVINVKRPPDIIAKQIADISSDLYFSMHSKKKYNSQEQYKYLENIFKVTSTLSSTKHYLMNFRDGRAYLLDYSSNKIFRSGLSLYQPANIKAQISLLLLKFLRLTGFAKFVFQKNKTIDLNGFLKKIKDILGNKVLNIAISLGAPGPLRKPVVKVFDKNKDLAFIKISPEEKVINALKHESEILTYLNKQNLNSIEIPRIIFQGEYNQNFMLLMKPLPNPVDKITLSKMHIPVILDVFKKINFQYLYISDSKFIQNLEKRINKMENSYYKYLCIDILDSIKHRSDNILFPFHFAHGDLTRWNGYAYESKIALYDFEYACMQAPAGYDLIRFILQEALHVKKKKLPAIHCSMVGLLDSEDMVAQYFHNLIKNNNDLNVYYQISYGLYLVTQLCNYALNDAFNVSNMNTYRYLTHNYQLYLDNNFDA